MLKRIGAEEGGEFKAVASGTLPSGKPVVVNADGTVSTVSQTSQTQAIGSSASYESDKNGSSVTAAIVYDSTNNKVVIVYKDAANSSYGTAVVGTVSGTSISFGDRLHNIRPIQYNLTMQYLIQIQTKLFRTILVQVTVTKENA